MKKYILLTLSFILIVTVFSTVSSKKEPSYRCQSNDKICQNIYFTSLRASHDVKYILNQLDLKNQNKKIANCHEIAHQIGILAFKQRDRELWVGKYEICSEGYLHGVFEEAGREGDLTFIKNNATLVCKDDEIVETCLHGVGHGYFNAGATLKEVFNICSNLSLGYKRDVNLLNLQCITGYAMEEKFNYSKANPPIVSIDIINSECGFTEDPICKISLVRNMLANTSLNDDTLKNRASEIDKYCNGLKDKYYEWCQIEIGYGVTDTFRSTPTSKEYASKINLLCSKGSKFCVEGALSVKIVQTNIYDKKFMEEVCANLEILGIDECLAIADKYKKINN